MICVKSVDIVQVPKDHFEIATIGKHGMHKEVVYGDVFFNERGEEVCLALTREVQITLGIPFKAFKDMNQRIADLSAEVGQKKAQLALSNLKLSTYEGAGLFQRLKYLFTGQIIE